jgi:hypothetical protein
MESFRRRGPLHGVFEDWAGKRGANITDRHANQRVARVDRKHFEQRQFRKRFDAPIVGRASTPAASARILTAN